MIPENKLGPLYFAKCPAFANGFCFGDMLDQTILVSISSYYYAINGRVFFIMVFNSTMYYRVNLSTFLSVFQSFEFT